MDSLTLIGVSIYFIIGWFLSDILTKDDDKEEVVMFTLLFWPIYIVVLVFMFVLVILMVIAVFMTKLINGFRGKGDKPDGAV